MKLDIKAILALIALLGFILLLVAFLFAPIPVDNKPFVYAGAMALIGIIGTIIGYYFGSSEGSKRKTELLAKKEETAT
jgi:drug/metabolite transporter (DMT)-like permease